jgi:lipopolysaccharide export system permease protein
LFRKLDILILKAFIGPFIATFIVSEFILVMQFYWLYIDDFVGKGLDLGTIGYITWLVAITSIPLALPLALLISSIMTFGNLGETFEIVAIKSAGISLARFMRPLLITTIFISGIAFIFTNNIIPFATLKLGVLKHDIFVAKPALDIKEGEFYDKINGYVIKVAKKENDSIIHNVLIYEATAGLQDNILTAETGVMRVSRDRNNLEFTLRNGWRYSEKGSRGTTNTEFTRLGFKEYTKLFDLQQFQNKREDSEMRYDPIMLSVRQLNYTIDSLEKKKKTDYVTRSKMELNPWVAFSRFADSNWTKIIPDTFHIKKNQPVIPEAEIRSVYDRAISQLQSVRTGMDMLNAEYTAKQESLIKHYIEWHKKFSLSFACIVLFMIGAPLGSIIRKGGLGMPLVFALIFFVIFHLLNTFGAKFAKEAVLSPFVGIWLASIVLTPVGIFLTYKAMRDSQLFNKEYYLRTVKKIRMFFVRKRSKNSIQVNHNHE